MMYPDTEESVDASSSRIARCFARLLSLIGLADSSADPTEAIRGNARIRDVTAGQ